MEKLYNNRILTKFIIIQPLIDIITSLMINEFNLSISIGMIFRFIFLAYSLIYILKNRNNLVNIYLVVWIIYLLTNLTGNILFNYKFEFILYFKSISKLIYFPIVLLFYTLYFKKNEQLDGFSFVMIGLIIGISLFLSVITNTAYCSYSSYENCYRKGIVSWFNSANEYGLILISILGFTIIDLFKKENIYNILSLIFTVIFLCILGTKASYIGCVGILLSSFVFYIIYNKHMKKGINRLVSVFIGLLSLSVLISTFKLPIYTNLVGSYERAYENSGAKVCEFCSPRFDKTSDEIKEEISNSIIYSGRSEFLNAYKVMYKNSSVFSHLYGLNESDLVYNGVNYTHIVERDFHDLFFQYGIIGFIIELSLPMYLIYLMIRKNVKEKKIVVNEEIFVLFITLSLILLGSYLAGHFLFSPGVSIYVAYGSSLLYKKVMNYEKENRDISN